jgi:DNA replication protein DnaC
MKDIREHSDYALRYQNLPLLIIDDIGSEPTIPNVSNEWLFSIVNERILATRATVLSSNYTLIQLQEKYGERFMSRLCDKNTTQLLQLVGNNLRINKQ